MRSPVLVPVLMREWGNSPRGASEGEASLRTGGGKKGAGKFAESTLHPVLTGKSRKKRGTTSR
jgi:hypothetical protein